MKVKSIAFLLGIVCSVGAYAQAVIGFGTVTGTVRDYTDSGIPDTTVILSNEKMGVRREMDTTDEGTFIASDLIPGAGYSLKITRKGFLDLEFKDFEVLVGHTVHLRISLVQDQPNRRGETEKASVEVEDAGYELQTALSQSDLIALPSRNLDVNTLVKLTPAITTDSATGQLAFHSERSSSALTTDGVLTTNSYFYDKAPIGPAVSQEAVEELQIISAGAPAEFGHTMSGAINVVTRSGGDAIHGALYDYFNTHSLNAADRFAPGFVPPGWQHQFGLNAGGPVGEKKIFWFVNLEDLDGHFQELNRTSNSLLVDPVGMIAPSNCTVATTTATAAQCASAISFLNAQLNRVVQSSLASLTGFAKADWRPNEFNAISVEADAMHRHSPNGTNTETAASNAEVLGNNGTYTDESRFAKASYTAVWSGNAVNEVRGGWYHDRFSDYPDSLLLPSTGNLGIYVAGTPFGGNPNFPMALSEQRYQLVDNVTAALGNHLFKLGVDYSTTEDRNGQIIGKGGEYFYPSLTTFAEDFSANTAGRKDYTSFVQNFGQPVIDLHTKRLNIYAQDTWRPSRRVTLNFGILWEKTYVPQPVNSNAVFFQTGTIASPDTNFAPRLGIAYQLDDRTVIRVGLGAFYQPFPGQLLETLYTGNAVNQLPITVTPGQPNSPIFARIVASPNTGPPGTEQVTYAVSKLRSPVVAQGLLTIERRLNNNWTISLNYLYNRGISLWAATEENLNAPTITKTYTIDNAAGTPVDTYTTQIYNAKTNVNFGHVYQIGNGGHSSYEGAALQVRKRMSHGVAAQLSYTWSHATDDVSGSPVLAGFIPTSSTPGIFSADQGNSSFNQASRAVMTWSWQPTFVKNDSLAARYLINGWQVSGSATLASSLPETPIVIVNGQQFLGLSMTYTSSLNGSGGWSRVPFDGVNGLLTGPQYGVDARLSRQLPITERVKATLMLEAFDMLNTQFNTSLNTIAYQATSGVLRPVSGLGLGNGAAGFPWGDNARHVQLALRIVF